MYRCVELVEKTKNEGKVERILNEPKSETEPEPELEP